MNVAERFGANLIRCRKLAGLSRTRPLCGRRFIGPEISQIERGLRTPRVDTLVKLMAALEVDADELLAGLEWRPGETRVGRFTTPDQGATL